LISHYNIESEVIKHADKVPKHAFTYMLQDSLCLQPLLCSRRSLMLQLCNLDYIQRLMVHHHAMLFMYAYGEYHSNHSAKASWASNPTLAMLFILQYGLARMLRDMLLRLLELVELHRVELVPGALQKATKAADASCSDDELVLGNGVINLLHSIRTPVLVVLGECCISS
jgi:hypothetical protein